MLREFININHELVNSQTMFMIFGISRSFNIGHRLCKNPGCSYDGRAFPL